MKKSIFGTVGFQVLTLGLFSVVALGQTESAEKEKSKSFEETVSDARQGLETGFQITLGNIAHILGKNVSVSDDQVDLHVEKIEGVPVQVIATHPHPDTTFEDKPLSAIGSDFAFDIHPLDGTDRSRPVDSAKSGAAKDAQTKLMTKCEELNGILIDDIKKKITCTSNLFAFSCTAYATATCRIQKEIRAG